LPNVQSYLTWQYPVKRMTSIAYLLAVLAGTLVSCTAPTTPVPMWWGLHDGSDGRRLELEVGTPDVRPDYVRVLDTDGSTVAISTEVVDLRPETGAVGLCGSRSPRAPLWAIIRPPQRVIDALLRGSAGYAFEAHVAGSWRPVLAHDSGCRASGQG
jgi:hypothetical protein